MGMFDSLYDQRGDEWQTKAFRCLLDRYEIGDELPGPPIDYQVEILGGLIELGEDISRDSYATIRAGTLEIIDVPRDPTLPLRDYFGGWPKTEDPDQARRRRIGF